MTTTTAIVDRPSAPMLLDAPQFAAIVSKYIVDKRAVRDLHLLLMQLATVGETHAVRMAWLEDLSGWIRAEGAGFFGRVSDAERTKRLLAFVRALGTVKDYRESFAALLHGVVSELHGTKLFSDVGIPVEAGFWREAVERVSRRMLPTLPVPRSFTDFIERLFPTKAEARWLALTPPDAWRKLWVILETTKAPLSTAWMPLAGSLADAMRILAARVAALGVAQDVRDRLPSIPVSRSPFLSLPNLCDTVQVGPPRLSTSNEGALAMIDECRDALRLVHAHVEEYGVSVDLVYRLELMEAQLSRLEQLVALLIPKGPDALAQNLGRFARDIVRAQFQNRSILELVGRSSHLLARKVVERSGRTGEHYITRTRAEWRTMLLSAAGGGFLTTFTAALKVLIGKLGAPLLVTTALSVVNYAGSFLLMGAIGFTLATKQPSMTAAALATASEQGDAKEHDRLVTLIAQISRSQLAAAIGNVGMVLPVALLFDLVWRIASGHPFLGVDKAAKVVVSLNPHLGGVVPYAALTGVLLWMSSIAAGWFENWITYRHLPEALAKNRRFKRLVGPERAKRWAGSLERNATSVAGSLSLGFLLGVVPMLGTWLGLPLDVRHVTLSTGSLAFAGSALGLEGIRQSEFLGATFGILIIGALNFGVSFFFALAVAFRARNRWRTGTTSALGDLLVALARRFVRSPLEFFVPPRS